MMYDEQLKLEKMQEKARAIGLVLSSPLADMYGGYECSIEDPNTGAMSVVMNCASPIEAAAKVLEINLPENNLVIPTHIAAVATAQTQQETHMELEQQF